MRTRPLLFGQYQGDFRKLTASRRTEIPKIPAARYFSKYFANSNQARKQGAPNRHNTRRAVTTGRQGAKTFNSSGKKHGISTLSPSAMHIATHGLPWALSGTAFFGFKRLGGSASRWGTSLNTGPRRQLSPEPVYRMTCRSCEPLRTGFLDDERCPDDRPLRALRWALEPCVFSPKRRNPRDRQSRQPKKRPE